MSEPMKCYICGRPVENQEPALWYYHTDCDDKDDEFFQQYANAPKPHPIKMYREALQRSSLWS